MDKLIKNVVIKPGETKAIITEEDDENKEQESIEEKNKTLNSKQDEDLIENRKKSSSFIVNVNLNENDNSSNLNVKININDTSSKDEISNINSPHYRNSTDEAKNESKRDSKFSKMSKEEEKKFDNEEEEKKQNENNNDNIIENNENEHELENKISNEEEKKEEEEENKENESNKENLSNNENEEEHNYKNMNIKSDSDEYESSENENEEEKKSISKTNQDLNESKFENIEDYYAELRKKYGPSNQWEDPDFGADKAYFEGDAEDDIKSDLSIEFERLIYDDDKANFFIYENSSHNIDYEFKIKRGIMQDRFFLGAFLMLFRRREEYFQNLILDNEHIKENINAGFCGFTFFINGEWKNITIDTRLPKHQNDEFSLSNTETPNAYWMCLFEKAYAKAFRTYSVLDQQGVNDFLVDLTGGWARMTHFNSGKDSGFDENKKKALFEEIQKSLNLKYLIGCMKYDETKLDEDLDADKSEDGTEDEAIAPNCMHNILDAQEDNGVRLIYLVNYWPKGKWTGSYSVEDETWEANKALAERLNYQVSQSDGTFWMSFDDWITYFNRVYYCRIFPESWSQYVIPGKWTSISSGGAPPKHTPWYPEKYHPQDTKQTPGIGSTLTGLKEKTNLMTPSSMNIQKQKNKLVSPSIMGGIGGTPSINKTPMVGGLMTVKGTSYLNPSIKKTILPSPLLSKNTPSLIKQTPMKSVNSTKSGQNSNKNQESVEKKTKLPAIKKPQPPKIIHNTIKRNIIEDTEDRWFLNPQYKIEIIPGTRMIISLMQQDKKLDDDKYLKTCFYLIYCKGRYSRVWELDEDKIIKKAEDEPNQKAKREIIIQIDYYEALKKINENRKKKLPKGEIIQMNLIPFIDYNTKYEINKVSKTTIQFKTYAIEAVFWLRIFASTTNIYIAELARPFESTATSGWTMEKEMTSGGARYITEKKGLVENSKWPINPQFLITFEKNTIMKIILKKTTGHFSIEENKIGFLLTKPEKNKDEGFSLKQRTATNFNKTLPMFMKTQQIFRVMESTARILDTKKNTLGEIYPKMFINNSEWVIESSYSNSYCASLNLNFNRIDSPLIIIPTLDTPNNPFEFEIKIYSNRPTSIFSLNGENCKLLKSEWNENNCGGSHLSKEEKKKKLKEDDTYMNYKKEISWYDNPKFNLSFKNKETIPEVEFEIVLTRTESIWKPIISKGTINSMVGIYVFEYDLANWRNKCVNMDQIEFLPKNQIKIKINVRDVRPQGFIIMPVTYGSGIKGPFLIMAKSQTKFNFVQMDEKFN